VEELIKIGNEDLDLTLVHYDKMPHDPLYRKVGEIVMPQVKFPVGAHFLSQLIFFWKYRRESFDIIHWFQPRLYPFFWLAPAKRLVVTVHGAGMVTSPGKKFNLANFVFNQTLVWFSQYLSVVIAGSEFGKKEIADSYKIPVGKIVVTYYGGGDYFKVIEKSAAQKLVEEKLGIKPGYFLSVARLQPHKNVNSIVKSFVSYRDLYPDDKTCLVIVGWPTEDFLSTYDLANKSRYAQDIIFIDHVEEEMLNPLYSAAEAFLFLSLNEGFGLPVVEAMASGTPVIVANTTSLPEVSGGHAVVVEPFDYQATAEALHRIVSDLDFRETLINQGKLWAREFSWHNTAQTTSNIYKNLVK
jgi:glycosyltransferase involved in cell wall biosynthesis